MGYVDQTLVKGEEIVGTAKLHWLELYLWPTILVGIYVVFAVANDNWFTFHRNGYQFIILLWGALLFFIKLIVQKTSEFVATNRRVVMKTGFIQRSTLEFQYEKIESIMVDQGLLDRILGAGKLTIRGTGGGKETFHGIEDPFLFRSLLDSQMSIKENETKSENDRE
tara:strand:+ start:313 stop:813 length:501 start_codon:yes stop_codon:yes gene_type:complete